MIGLAALALATTIYSVEDPCAKSHPEVMMAIRRAAREQYEDPSKANSKRLTEGLVREVLTPLSTAESLRDQKSVVCLEVAISEINRFGIGDREPFFEAFATELTFLDAFSRTATDPSVASEAHQAFTALRYYSSGGDWVRSFPRVAPSRALVDHAKESCGNPRFATCAPPDAEVLVMAVDPGAAAAIEKSIHRHDETGPSPHEVALKEWIQLEALYPDPVERSAIALRPPFPEQVSPEGSSTQLLRMWALNALLDAGDPRDWSPDAIAIVVLAAREAEATSVVEDAQRAEQARVKAAADAGRRVIEFSTGGFPRQRCRGYMTAASDGRCSLEQYLDVLSRMGIRRAFDLVKPVTIPFPDSKGSDWVHFGGERELYAAEWQPSSGLSQDEFGRREWERTDSKAPAPDLKAVEAAIARRISKANPLMTPARSSEPDPTVPTFEIMTPLIDRKAPCQSTMRDELTKRLLCPGDPHLFAPLSPTIETQHD